MSTEFKQADPVPPFAQATGYATAVDAALAWADGSIETPPTLPMLAPLRRPTEATTECVARILAAEVRRLRENATETSAAFAQLASALNDCAIVGTDAEMDAYERAKESVHRALLKSHNESELSDGSTKTNPNT